MRDRGGAASRCYNPSSTHRSRFKTQVSIQLSDPSSSKTQQPPPEPSSRTQSGDRKYRASNVAWPPAIIEADEPELPYLSVSTSYRGTSSSKSVLRHHHHTETLKTTNGSHQHLLEEKHHQHTTTVVDSTGHHHHHHHKHHIVEEKYTDGECSGVGRINTAIRRSSSGRLNPMTATTTSNPTNPQVYIYERRKLKFWFIYVIFKETSRL